MVIKQCVYPPRRKDAPCLLYQDMTNDTAFGYMRYVNQEGDTLARTMHQERLLKTMWERERNQNLALGQNSTSSRILKVGSTLKWGQCLFRSGTGMVVTYGSRWTRHPAQDFFPSEAAGLLSSALCRQDAPRLSPSPRLGPRLRPRGVTNPPARQ